MLIKRFFKKQWKKLVSKLRNLPAEMKLEETYKREKKR